MKMISNKIEKNNFNKEEDDHLTIGVAGKIKDNKNKERIKCR
jgi:hypothetical protein